MVGVTTIWATPDAIALNCGTLPLPAAASPIAVLSLVHVKVAPDGVETKLLDATEAPIQ